MGRGEYSSVKSPSKNSQLPCQQQLPWHFRLGHDGTKALRVRGPDSAGLRLRLQNARRSSLDSASCTVFGIRRGSDRTSEGLRRPTMGLPSVDPHRPAGGCWRVARGGVDSGRLALIVPCRPSRSTGGTRQAKAQPANENYVHSGNESPGQTFGNHSDTGPDAGRHSGKSVAAWRHEPAERSG
jgi:hypothetical protein